MIMGHFTNQDKLHTDGRGEQGKISAIIDIIKYESCSLHT